MTPFCKSLVSDETLALFTEIRRTVIAIPDLDLGVNEDGERIELSCHMLARAVASVWKVKCVDGYYYPCLQHSWNTMPGRIVIDAYPVYRVEGPSMMVGGFNRLTDHYYFPRPSSKIGLGRFSKPSFRRSVRRIIKALEKAKNDPMPK
jgi:hypothetical protein